MSNPTLTQTQLAAALRVRKGAFPVTITAQTFPKMNVKSRVDKTPNPYGQIRKLYQINGIVNYNYENAVKKATGDDSFVAGERSNGTRVEGTPFVLSSQGNTLLRVKHEKTTEHARYFTESGVQITREEAAPFIPKPREYVPGAVRPNDPMLSRMVGIAMNGEVYDVSTEGAEAVNRSIQFLAG